MVNELAKPVLVLNLPAADGGGTAAGELANLAAISGEPLHLSLRALLRQNVPWDVAGRDIFVCENPNLLAIAADRLGSSLRAARLRRMACRRPVSEHFCVNSPNEARACATTATSTGLECASPTTSFVCSERPRGGSVRRTIACARGDRCAVRPCTASWDAALAPAMIAGGTVLEEEAEEIATMLMEDLAGSAR